MSIETKASRIITARDKIRSKLVTLGLASGTDKLDKLATAVDDISNMGAVSATVKEGETYTIPKGYHTGSGTVSGVAGGGNYSLQSKGPIVPGKQQVQVTPDNGCYGLSDVTIDVIPDKYQDVSEVTAGAADVMEGKKIVTSTGAVKEGTIPNNGAWEAALDASKAGCNIPAGYHDGNGFVVARVMSSVILTPTRERKEYFGEDNMLFRSVYVNAIPNEYQDVSGVTATADKVLAGSTFVDAKGNEVAGTMPNIGQVYDALDITRQRYTIPAGYHDGTGIITVARGTKTVTPTKDTQTVQDEDGRFLTRVIVNPISDVYQDVSGVTATKETVLEGMWFVDAEGKLHQGIMDNHGFVEVVLKNEMPYAQMLPGGYYDSILIYPKTRNLTATPAKEDQVFETTEGEFFTKVTVNPIPDKYQDVSEVDATASDVLAGKKFVDSTGKVVVGTATLGGASVTVTDDGDGNLTFNNVEFTEVDGSLTVMF